MSDVVKGLREAASGKGGLDYGDLWAYCDEAADEIERLEAELAEARLNDERYRWLRRRNELTEADDPRGPFVIELLDDDTIHHMTGDEIDAAIDAARGGDK